MTSRFLIKGIFAAMSISLATSALAQSNNTPETPEVGDLPLQLLVVLPVKPDHLKGFLTTMHKEVAGARSEDGNVAFDVYEDSVHPGTLYLYEHWISASALSSHTEQPYYKAIRAQEPDDIAGTVQERTLTEISPVRTAVKGSLTNGYNVLTVIKTPTDARVKVKKLFTEMAPGIRSSDGNRDFRLYEDRSKPSEFVLIERWSDQSARDLVDATSQGRQFRTTFSQLPTQEVDTAQLIDRSLAQE